MCCMRWRDCLSGSIANEAKICRTLFHITSTPPQPPRVVVFVSKVKAMSQLAPGHFLFTSESVGEGHPGSSAVFAGAFPLVLTTKTRVFCR